MQTSNDIDPDTQVVIKQPGQARGWFVALLLIGLAAGCSALLWFSLTRPAAKEEKEEVSKPNTVDLHQQNANEIATIVASSNRPSASFSVPATVEANQQQLQQVTPLVSGRVRNIYVSLGDNVARGTLLLKLDSPQVAELHGKLHEAETRVLLAKSAIKRVKASASRVNVLKAKAGLDEAEATLRRTKLLISEGITAKKDLVAAQSEYDRALADYNFQKDISLNREVAEAQAEHSTASTEAEHLEDGLRALDAQLPKEGQSDHDISTIELRSPIAGTVIERFVNQGSGFDQGKPLLTIANTSSLWVIANVPEKQMTYIRVGSAARILIDASTVTGTVSYLDPRLNEDTRTARVRIEIANPGNKIKAGNFAQVEFQEPPEFAKVYVPSSAVQTVEGGKVVFAKVGNGQFAVRKITAGPTVSDMVPVLSGLKPGEIVAVNGSFILKSKLLKEQFGDDD